MTFSLETNGDHVERTHWPEVKNLAPRYEAFWQAYIAPLTYRTLVEDNIHLRMGPPQELRDLANAVYRCFKLITEAITTLQDDTVPSDDKSCREFFENMYALTDSYRTVFGTLRGVGKMYGAGKDELSQRFAAAGLAPSWPIYEDAVKMVSDYRTPYTHLTPPPRYGELIPARHALNSYKNTSDIKTHQEAGHDIAADFVSPRVVGEAMFEETAKCFDLVIAVALHELSSFPKQADLTNDIARTSPNDHRLANDEHFWTALSGVVPDTDGIVVVRPSDIGGVQHEEK